MKGARAALVLGAALAVPMLQARLDARLGRFRAQEEIRYVWSGDQLKRMAKGLEDVAADLYWLRTIQYFGGTRLFAKERRFELLEPLVDITVTLDPRFEIAYRYGATFLAEPPPRGAGRAETAIKLLERGARHLPRAWLLHQNLGFFAYLYLGDAQRGAAALMAARKEPGSPLWLESLAAGLLQEGGERQKARRVWTRIYESNEGPMRENALLRIRRLDAEDVLRIWDERIREFRRERGRPPRNLAETQSGAGVPTADPTGVSFGYDPREGRIGLSRESTIWHQTLEAESRTPLPLDP